MLCRFDGRKAGMKGGICSCMSVHQCFLLCFLQCPEDMQIYSDSYLYLYLQEIR